MKANPPEYSEDAYMSLLLKAVGKNINRILIGIPMMGLIRAEWAIARWGQSIPCNWSASEYIQLVNQVTPLGYSVADARNIIVKQAIEEEYEWLFFIDSDVMLPPDCFIKLNAYMREGNVPVVNGLYFAKCHPPEPLIYRGRGNSYFRHWKLGEKVWVDGISMGCTLINVVLLKAMYDEAPEYLAQGKFLVRKVFDTPSFTLIDPEGIGRNFSGTEDLSWCDRVMYGEFLKKSGWHKIAKRRYPFLCDTSIFCWHLDPSGRRYPLEVRW